MQRRIFDSTTCACIWFLVRGNAGGDAPDECGQRAFVTRFRSNLSCFSSLHAN
jgi:CXCXC repeat protein